MSGDGVVHVREREGEGELYLCGSIQCETTRKGHLALILLQHDSHSSEVCRFIFNLLNGIVIFPWRTEEDACKTREVQRLLLLVHVSCPCTVIIGCCYERELLLSCKLSILGRQSGVSACARFVVRFVGHHSRRRRRPLILSSSSLLLPFLRAAWSVSLLNLLLLCPSFAFLAGAWKKDGVSSCRPRHLFIKHWLRTCRTALLRSSSLLVEMLAAATAMLYSKTKRETIGITLHAFHLSCSPLPRPSS